MLTNSQSHLGSGERPHSKCERALVATRVVLRKYGTLLAVALFVVVMPFLSPYFLNARNLLNVLRQASVTTLLGLALTLPMLCKKFDISIGAVAGLGAVLTAFLTVRGMSLLPALVCALAVGAALGAISGIAVAFLKINDFVATIAVMLLACGLDLLLNGGGSIRIPRAMGEGLRALGSGSIAGVPNAAILLGGVILASFILAERTWVGRQMYAIGGNERTSYLSGIRVRSIVLLAYVLSGILASLGGFVSISRTMGAQPLGGMSLLTLGIAVMFIGQTMFRVGRANVLGTAVGGLFVTLMGNAFVLLNIAFYYEYMLWGVIVLGAMMFSAQTQSE